MPYDDEQKLECLRCGHGTDPNRPWLSRVKGRPKACPNCHSRVWDTPPLEDVECQQCKNIFRPLKENRVKCPRCGSRRWNKRGPQDLGRPSRKH